MRKFTLLMMSLLLTVGAMAQKAHQRVSHEGWVVTALNEAGVVGNEGGVAFIADDNAATFYHSDYNSTYEGGTGVKKGQDGLQAFMVELPTSLSDLSLITYKGRSDNHTSGWARGVRVYVFETLPEGWPANGLSSLSYTEKQNLLSKENANLGTAAFDNTGKLWADNQTQKLVEFATPQTGKYVLFIMDAGHDNWLTCSDFQIYQHKSYSAIVEGDAYYLQVTNAKAEGSCFVDTKTANSDTSGPTIGVSTTAVETYFDWNENGWFIKDTEGKYIGVSKWCANPQLETGYEWQILVNDDNTLNLLQTSYDGGGDNSRCFLGGDVTTDANATKLYTDSEKGKAINIRLLNKSTPIDYTALNEAIAAANTALTNAGYQLTAGEAVALQIDDAKAAGYLSVSHPACDGDVLKNAIDSNPNTLYHSDWTAGASTPYMQVDLGEGVALDAFVLNYSTRQSGNNGAPYAMTVSGSNDGTNFTTITNLSKSDAFFPLPSGNAQSFSSMIAANEAYRYLRFTVTSSPNGNNSFGVSSFGIQKATVEGEKTGLPMRCATIYNALAKAVALNNNANSQPEVNEMVAYLNKIVAHATVVYPFELTTDINNPVCYLIKAGREKQGWTNPYWTYSENGIIITKYDDTEASAKNVNAYWFFMADDKSGFLRMYPYVEKNSAMGYVAVASGADKITNAATAVNNVYELVNTTTDEYAAYPYALKPCGYNTYVSNHGGDGKRLGFHTDLVDGGTRFALVEAITPSAKLAEIAKLIETVAGYKAGTAIGSYSEEGITALATAVAAATEVLNDATSNDEACQAQIDALNNAVANLAIVLPVEGTFYVIRNAQTNTCVYSKADNKLYHTEDVTNASVWQFVKNEDGSFKLYNVNNGQFLKSLVWTNPSLLGDDACKVEISSCKVAGENYVFIKGNGNGIDGQQMHAQLGGDAPLVFYNESIGKSKSSWVIEEFTGTLSHTLTVGAAGYATLMLGYNTTIPAINGEECGVFTAVVNGDWATLTEVEGVLPANTAVIVKAPAGDYEFVYTTETATVENNDLRGTLYNKNMTDPAYVLGIVDNEVGLYTAANNVSTNTENDDPEVTYEAWLNNANKAYLPKPAAEGVSFYGFRFDEEENTTGIEVVENANENVIYDLAGRRVSEITAPGIYIIDGKKVLVK